jgi:hypothetical protein
MKVLRFFRGLVTGRMAREPRPESIVLRQKRGKGLSGKPGGKRFLAYSPEFKEFVREHKGILVPTKNFFLKNFSMLEALPEGQEVVDEKTGIKVRKELTGSYKGLRKDSTFKVVAGGKEFFLKIRFWLTSFSMAGRIQKLDSFLRKRNYKINGFNVRIIKPHLMYEGPDGTSWLVTDFYNEGKVKMVEDFNLRTLRPKIDKVLGDIPIGSDINPGNSFYEIKTNTIWLFDI